MASAAGLLLVAVSLVSCDSTGSGSSSKSGVLEPGLARTASVRLSTGPGTGDRATIRPRPEVLAGPPPGRLILQRRLVGTGIRGQVFRVVYHSRNTRDIDVPVTGLVMLPGGSPPAGGWPVLAYGHPTGASADACAPSAHLEQAPVDVWTAVLDRHIAIAATDYEGLGGQGRHPYLVGPSEARSMIDAVRAARQLSAGRIGRRYIAWGNSQGGHAAVFTATASPRWAPELRLLAVVAVAPVSDLKVFFNQGGLSSPDVFSLLLASGYSAAYPQADPRLFLRPATVARLRAVDASCAFGSAFVGIPGGVKLRRAADSPVWRKLLEANSLGKQRVKTPILLIHGLDDHVITADQTFKLFARFCAAGDVVVARFYAGLGHGSILSGSLAHFINWIKIRFAGGSAASMCPHGVSATAVRKVSVARR
jgi:alpha-beta hydrolase superfamily lysophospholipase